LYQIAENLVRLETSVNYWIRTTKGNSKLKLNSRQQEKQNSERLQSKQKFLSKKHRLIHACTKHISQNSYHFSFKGWALHFVYNNMWGTMSSMHSEWKEDQNKTQTVSNLTSSPVAAASSYIWHIAIFVSHCIEQRI